MRASKLITPLAILGGLFFTSPAALAKAAISIGVQQEPTTLDPTTDATASIDGMLTHNVYESLTTVAQDGSVHPDLASSWDISKDGLTYTFHLVKGVTFQDGEPFSAADVKFTFDRAMGKDSTNPSKGIFKPIESVTVVDPDTVKITLKRPDAFFLFNIGRGDASIVSPKTADGDKTHPVGTGPYAFTSWTRGDRLVLTKYAGYRNAADVEMKKITFRFISDPAAASAALMAGTLDAFPGFPAPELLAQFKSDPRFKVTVGDTQGEVILALNNSRKPFGDIRVRRAIAYALDRKEIIDGAMYGMAKPIGSFFPPSNKAYVDLTGLYPNDDAKAKALLQEAGVAPGTELTLKVPPFPYAQRSAVIIQSELAKVGLNVKVEKVEWGYWIGEIYKKHNYEMTIIAHTAPNDMGNFAKGKGYYYGYDDPKFDALWSKIETQTDTVKRDALLKKGQRFLADQAVVGYLFELPKLGVYKKQLSGFWTNAPVQFQPLAPVKWTTD